MVLKEGVTEIQDSEDELLTSSPVRNVSPGNRQSSSSVAQHRPPPGWLDTAAHPASSNGGWDDNENMFAFEEHMPTDKSLILNPCPANQAANTSLLQQQAHISQHLTPALAEEKSPSLQDIPSVNMSSNTKLNIAGEAPNDTGGEELVKEAGTAEYDISLKESTVFRGEHGEVPVEQTTNHDSNRSNFLALGSETQPLKPGKPSYEMHPRTLENLEVGGVNEDIEPSVIQSSSPDEPELQGKVDVDPIVDDPATVQKPETTNDVTAEYDTRDLTVENKLAPFTEQADLPSRHESVSYNVVRLDTEQSKSIQDACKEVPADSEGSSSTVKRELPRENEPDVTSLANTWSNMQQDPLPEVGNIQPGKEQQDIMANNSAQESAPLHMEQKEPPETHTSVDVVATKDTTASSHPTQEALDPRPAATHGEPCQAPAPPAQSSSPTKASLRAQTPQETTLAELKAQRKTLLASLAALPAVRNIIASAGYLDDGIGSANDEDDDMTEPREPTELEIMGAANKIVKKHIKLLHEYNEIKDVGQGLMGLIADQRGVRIVEVQDEFGVGAKD